MDKEDDEDRAVSKILSCRTGVIDTEDDDELDSGEEAVMPIRVRAVAVPADGPPPIALELPPAPMLGGLISLGALLEVRVAGVGADQMDTTDMDTDAMAS